LKPAQPAVPRSAAAAGVRRDAAMCGCLLAFIAGYVDVIGFTALFGLFTAHVTGNFIMIGIELAGSSAGLLAKLLALPAFVAAVAATRLAESRIARTGRSPVVPLLVVEAVFLLLFMVAGLRISPITDAAAASAIATGLLAVVAMGIQNALSRTALADLGPTTIMTGNTTQIVIDLVDLPSAPQAQREAIRSRLGKMVPALAGFACGAMLGALAYSALSMWSVLVPVVLLGVVSRRA